MALRSPLGEFIEHARLAALNAGCSFSARENGDITLTNCSAAELSVFIGELHHNGFSVISSRQAVDAMLLGIMSTRSDVPVFFSVRLRNNSIRFPQTDGLFVAFLGPDGVGKTTTVDAVMATLKPIFGEQHLFHWRPQMIKPRSDGEEFKPGNGWTSINRHGDPPRGAFVSLLRIGGVYADYWLGHLRAIRPALSRGALVVFDRYYHDILVDSRRYRYGGPRFLLPLLKHFLPQRKPFFVILDADEQVILSRKQEVTAEELRRQRRRYQQLASKVHALHVRTDSGRDNTVAEVLRGIGNHLAHRFDERLLRHTTDLATSIAGEAIPAGKTA